MENIYKDIKEVKIISIVDDNTAEVDKLLSNCFEIFLMKAEKTNHFKEFTIDGKTKLQPYDRFVVKFVLGKKIK